MPAPKPPKTPVQQYQSGVDTFTSTWNARIDAVKESGHDPNILKPVVASDWQRFQQGKTPMVKTEAESVVNAILANQPTIQPKKRPTGILGTLSNIPSDIAGVVTGLTKLPQAIGNEVGATWNAIGYGDTPKGTKYEPSDFSLSGMAAAARNVAKSPGFRMIPGVQTLASSTTSEGRKEMQRHPVGTLLDVLPYAQEAGAIVGTAKAGGLGNVGDAMSATLHPSQAVADAGKGIEAFRMGETGTAAEALAKGQLGRAAFRGTTSLPLVGGQFGKIATNNPLAHIPTIAEKAGLSKQSSDVARGFSNANVKLSDSAQKFLNEMGIEKKFVKGLSMEDRAMIHDTLSTLPKGTTTDLATPERIAAARTISDYLSNRELKGQTAFTKGIEKQVPKGRLWQYTHNGTTHTFSTTGEEGRLLQYLNNVNKAKSELPRLERAVEEAKSLSAQELDRAKFKLKKGQRTAAIADKKFELKLGKTPEARFKPLVERHMTEMGHAVNSVRNASDKATFDRVTSELEQGSFKSIPDAFPAIKKAAEKQWLKYTATHDPVWIPQVGMSVKEASMRPTILSEAINSPSHVKARLTDFTPHLHDVALGYTHAAIQDLREAAAEEYQFEIVLPKAQTHEQLMEMYKNVVNTKKATAIESKPGLVESAWKREWTAYDPRSFMPSSARLGALPKEQLFIPNWLARDLHLLMPGGKFGATPIIDRATGLFKVAVLTSPRHLAHIGLGGMTQLALPEAPGILRYFRQARNLMRDARENPEKFIQGLNRHQDQLTAGDMWNVAAGRQAGQWLIEEKGGLAKAVQSLHRMEEYALNMERTMAYLHGKNKALKSGLGEASSHEAGLTMAHKLLVDINALTPLERTMTRHLIPFYPFTKHLIRYIMALPIDHPLRAAIITNLAEMETKDWNSGLPQLWMHLLFLGGKDKEGNQAAWDVRSANPFRSLSNNFTLTGFIGTLNPAITGLASAAGLDVMSGSASLYPDVHVNPQTGKLEASRPSNSGLRFLTAYVPQVQTLDGLIGLSDQARHLNQTNPEKFRTALNNLGFGPFAGPSNYNIPKEQMRTEIARYKTASTAASRAVQSGDMKSLSGYDKVPFQGQITTPNQIGSILSSVQPTADALGISPKLLISHPQKARKPRKVHARHGHHSYRARKGRKPRVRKPKTI